MGWGRGRGKEGGGEEKNGREKLVYLLDFICLFDFADVNEKVIDR